MDNETQEEEVKEIEVIRAADGTFISCGNPNGRPVGSKNKVLTDRQLRDRLGKRTEFWIYQIEKIAAEAEDIMLKFRCYNQLLNYDFQIRASEYKKILDKRRYRLMEKQIKQSLPTNEEDNVFPLVSTTAM